MVYRFYTVALLSAVTNGARTSLRDCRQAPQENNGALVTKDCTRTEWRNEGSTRTVRLRTVLAMRPRRPVPRASRKTARHAYRTRIRQRKRSTVW